MSNGPPSSLPLSSLVGSNDSQAVAASTSSDLSNLIQRAYANANPDELSQLLQLRASITQDRAEQTTLLRSTQSSSSTQRATLHAALRQQQHLPSSVPPSANNSPEENPNRRPTPRTIRQQLHDQIVQSQQQGQNHQQESGGSNDLQSDLIRILLQQRAHQERLQQVSITGQNNSFSIRSTSLPSTFSDLPRRNEQQLVLASAGVLPSRQQQQAESPFQMDGTVRQQLLLALLQKQQEEERQQIARARLSFEGSVVSNHDQLSLIERHLASEEQQHRLLQQLPQNQTRLGISVNGSTPVDPRLLVPLVDELSGTSSDISRRAQPYINSTSNPLLSLLSHDGTMPLSSSVSSLREMTADIQRNAVIRAALRSDTTTRIPSGTTSSITVRPGEALTRFGADLGSDRRTLESDLEGISSYTGDSARIATTPLHSSTVPAESSTAGSITANDGGTTASILVEALNLVRASHDNANMPSSSNRTTHTPSIPFAAASTPLQQELTLGADPVSGPQSVARAVAASEKQESDEEEYKESSASDSNQKKRKYHHETFAQKLHRLITDAESEGKGDVISFLDDGGFRVSKPQVFVQDIMGKYFRGNSWSSFRRQLFSYRFPVVKYGPNMGAYRNPLFLRGRPELSKYIERDTRYDRNNKARSATKNT